MKTRPLSWKGLTSGKCMYLAIYFKIWQDLNIKSQQTPVQTQMSSHTICLIYNCLKMFFTYVDGVQQNNALNVFGI